MEQDIFNLQFEIKNYLNRLHLKGTLTHTDEMEIESHIRDGVDSLEKKGLSAEEAFLVTLKRAGNADVLSAEFNKVNPFFVSSKIRSYSLVGLGLILSLGTILLLLYDLASMFRLSYLAQTDAGLFLKVFSYLALCIAILTILKWGKSFTIFLQNNIEQNPIWTASILFLLPLLSFVLQSIIVSKFGGRQLENIDFRHYNINDAEFINFSIYQLTVSALFVTLVLFDTVMKKRKPSGAKSLLKSPVTFLIFFCIVICLAAGMARYVHHSSSGFQISVFFAIVYTIGCFSIALYSNEYLWVKLLIFSLFGIFLGNLLVV